MNGSINEVAILLERNFIPSRDFIPSRRDKNDHSIIVFCLGLIQTSGTTLEWNCCRKGNGMGERMELNRNFIPLFGAKCAFVDSTMNKI